jgi:hypothetical protein
MGETAWAIGAAALSVLALAVWLSLLASARQAARNRHTLALVAAISSASVSAVQAAGENTRAITQPAPNAPEAVGWLSEDGPGDGDVGAGGADWTDAVPGLRDEDISGYPPGVVPPPPEGFGVGGGWDGV